ncbi:MAG: metal-dependent hydrolase, partial [bacterium]
PNYYGKYHRVVSHCICGLALVGLISALIAWGVTAVRPWRRFGWFVSPNLARDLRPVRPHFLWFLLVAEAAACIHWCGDVITGFGNLEPFWPWSSRDASLHAVTSFDWFVFSTTLGWHLLIRQLEWPRHREAIVSAAYFAIIVLYVLARLIWAEPTVW